MFEKQAMLAKKDIDFFIDCSFIFREKLMQNWCKSVQNDYLHKNLQKNMFGTWCFSEKSILNGFWESLRVLGKVQKGWATLGKTAPWRNFVQFCSFASTTFAAGSISTPFGHHLSQFWLQFAYFQAPFPYRSGTKETAYRQCSMTATHRLALKIAKPVA